MTELHFVDSNVLVYGYAADEPEKQRRAQAVMTALWQSRTGRLSVQVLNEFYVTVTRKLAAVPVDVVRREVRLLEAWVPCPLSLSLRERAWELEDRYHLSWWDSLIVAAAHETGCRYLLSEDLQDGQDLDGVLVRNPFARALPELGLPQG